jgi:antitoxin HigA-1
MTRLANSLCPVHPGEILREEYLSPLNMTPNALAMALHVPATRIHEIVNERRAITADTAERLARYFGGDSASWLALQATYDLKTLPSRRQIAKDIEPLRKAARS